LQRAPTIIMQHDDDTVDMVRHDHKRIQFDIGAEDAGANPFFVNNSSKRIHSHLPTHHLAKQTHPTLRADRNEIRARLGVIVTLQADGTPVMVSSGDVSSIDYFSGITSMALHSRAVGLPPAG